MAVGDGIGLRVDPEMLARLGGDLQTAAEGLPDAPPAFIVSGTDPVSLAIAGRLPDVEGGIQEALPQLKIDATTTASNVVSAAGQYQGTDEQLAAEYEKHQFDQAGTTTSGGGGADSMGQLSQMMSMPMQMASQAAQLPMQAMSAVASAPQAVMQGVQQISQMAGGMGKSDGAGGAQSGVPGVPGAELPEERRDEAEAKADDEREKDEREKKEREPGAAPGATNAERAPATSGSPTPAPQQNSPRHAAPDPTVNL